MFCIYNKYNCKLKALLEALLYSMSLFTMLSEMHSQGKNPFDPNRCEWCWNCPENYRFFNQNYINYYPKPFASMCVYTSYSTYGAYLHIYMGHKHQHTHYNKWLNQINILNWSRFSVFLVQHVFPWIQVIHIDFDQSKAIYTRLPNYIE